MQAKIKTEPYEYFDPVFDGSYEVPIDTEYNLPDYCADIQKILKCRVLPEISSYLISEDTLTCDGVCDIRVMYLDAKGGCIRCCDFTKEFSASIKIKSSEEKAVACIKAAAEHLTCRAVSARRIDLHIAVSLQVLAVVQKKELITSEIEDSTIEKRSQTIKAAQAVNAVSHQFTIEDYLPLKNGKPPIESILRKEISCRVSEFKTAEERLTVNGTANVTFLYLSSVDGSTTEKMTASIDFNQVIDCLGASEGCVCDVKVIPGESSIQPKEDNVGEYTGVNVLIKVFLVAFLYQECEVEIIDDAYSIAAPLDLHYSQSPFTEIHGIHSEILKKKCAITVNEDEIQKVIDLWSEQDDVQSYCEKGKINYRVRYSICILYMNAQGKILYTEKTFDYNFSCELESEQAKKSDTSFLTDIWEYRITDKNTVEVSTETFVTSLLYSKASVKYLTSAITDENGKAFEKGSKLLVYYAEQGENLWDIAKSHRALLSDIRSQNELYDETVPQSGPILICSR